MDINNFNETAIFDTLSDIIRESGVSKNVFPNRPSSSKNDLSDFVVCRISGRIDDLAAYGECVASIALFAKNVSNIKNKDKLSVMQERLFAGMPRSANRLLIDGRPDILGDTTDGNGYHVRIVNYSLIIKSV